VSYYKESEKFESFFFFFKFSYWNYLSAVRMNKNLINGCSEQQVTFRKSLRLFCRWEDNIKMHLKEIWWEGVDCIHLAQYKNHGGLL
jgi:hypothetical protein